MKFGILSALAATVFGKAPTNHHKREPALYDMTEVFARMDRQ